MRNLLFVAVLFISLSAKSQVYRYEFRIAEVTNTGDYKNISAELLKIFDVKPAFYPENLRITVNSTTNISRENFQNKMAVLGYTVILFSKQPFQTQTDIE